ncbi:MAG: hypothetical protein ACJ0G7_12225 [Parasynechococcus sp.]|uniref:hypothetical protein n=1 Tax=Parasynechococcus sp. TaxID=3101203 RepID=UPI003886510C
MKSPLLLAALLLVAPAAANAQSIAGSDDPNMSGTTQRMFIINATTPGGLTFSGAGTATFNNAVGTSNQFNVGSNTSIGVNASVSATQEFDGLSLGVMQLGAGSSLMQTNGTSSSAAATQAASAAANSVATETAQRESHSVGWEDAMTATSLASTTTGSYGSYDRNGDWQWSKELRHRLGLIWLLPAQASYGAEGQAAYETEQTSFNQFKNAYTTSYNENYNASYSSAYNNVITNSSSTATESSATGIIKGDFKSTEDSVTAIGQEGQLSSIIDSALAAATATQANTNSESWKAAFNAAYEAGYQQSVGQTNTQSDSEVAIEGLGAIASVNADEASSFTVNLDRLEAFKSTGTQSNSSATANGSATATLSTNSFATQNNQRTASAFMQAFAAQ